MKLFIAPLSALIGALIGAAASIITTHLANKHTMKLAAFEHEERLKAERRKKQEDTYEELQIAAIDYARSGVLAYFQIREQYASGKKHPEVRINDADDEKLRLNQARFVTLVGRVLDDDVREQAHRVRDAELQLTLYAENALDLELVFSAHNKEHTQFASLLESKLRSLYSNRDS